jgi:hypothetical protein
VDERVQTAAWVTVCHQFVISNKVFFIENNVDGRLFNVKSLSEGVAVTYVYRSIQRKKRVGDKKKPNRGAHMDEATEERWRERSENVVNVIKK